MSVGREHDHPHVGFSRGAQNLLRRVAYPESQIKSPLALQLKPPAQLRLRQVCRTYVKGFDQGVQLRSDRSRGRKRRRRSL
jgi:hypothetical protein